MSNHQLSRREFIKMSGMGLVGLLAPSINLQPYRSSTSQQGRVATRIIWMYDRPSEHATLIKICHRDTVLDILRTVLSEDSDRGDQVWYEVGMDTNIAGYVLSENIQPVKTLLNEPKFVGIPINGLLTEVTVPYTDAHESAETTATVAYRMYYETTHWVKSIIANQQGQIWYQVYDDKWDKHYYARGDHMRVMTAEELSPISPDVPDIYKKVKIHLENQLLIAYEKEKAVFTTPVSTGGIFRAGTYTTPKGSFITYYKRPSRHMAAGDLTASGFDLPGVPWVQYLTEGGISIHGTFWHNDFGRPRSHGCINLPTSAAKWLYRWTSPQVPIEKVFSYGTKGTAVEIGL